MLCVGIHVRESLLKISPSFLQDEFLTSMYIINAEGNIREKLELCFRVYDSNRCAVSALDHPTPSLCLLVPCCWRVTRKG